MDDVNVSMTLPDRQALALAQLVNTCPRIPLPSPTGSRANL